MKVPETAIIQVIAEASPHMGNPKYITARVERLMRAQPNVFHYVMSFEKELTVEGAVSVLFYAALVEQAVAITKTRSSAQVSYQQLDVATRSAPDLEVLASREPDLASFIASNVDLGSSGTALARRLLAQVAEALLAAD